MTTIAYLYQWVHYPTQKWYVGARYAKNCHPNDGYLCSSKVVKPLIGSNPKEWKRTVLCIGSPLYIVELESKYLTLLDAKNNIMSFNKHNGDGKFSCAGKLSPLKGRPSHRKGTKNSPEHIAKVSAALKSKPAHNKGKPSLRKGKPNGLKGTRQSEESNRRRSNTQKGIPKSAEHIAKVSAALTGKSRPKIVCRISDRKEMSLSHFNRYKDK